MYGELSGLEFSSSRQARCLDPCPQTNFSMAPAPLTFELFFCIEDEGGKFSKMVEEDEIAYAGSKTKRGRPQDRDRGGQRGWIMVERGQVEAEFPSPDLVDPFSHVDMGQVTRFSARTCACKLIRRVNIHDI